MAATLAQLLTAVTVTEAETLILALLEAVGFPATAWQKFSVPRTFVKLFAELYSDARTGITNIVKSRLLKLATGDALDYIAEHFFDLLRELATATEGEFVLDDDGGAPYDIEVGQLVVRDTATGKLYRNTTAGSLASGGSLTLSFKADETGSLFNISPNSAMEFAETFEGVSVTNPPIGSTGTWVTSTGTDDQSDDSLLEACRTKWATLGAGTKDAYAAWAIEGEPRITKVKVYGPDRMGPRRIRVILATDAGVPTADEVANANARIQAKSPKDLRSVTVDPVSAIPVTVDATVNVYSGADTYAAALAAALPALQTEVEIGDSLYLTRIDAFLHSPGAVRNAVITSPSVTVTGDFDTMPVVSIGTITINEVA